MKRKLIIISGVVVLIIGTLAILPFLYKDKLLVQVKATLNNQINAKIDFSDFKLSVFSHFPKVEMELKNLSLIGVDDFAGDTILASKSISTTISLMELIRNKGLELKSLTVENPRVMLIVNKSGASNWSITKASGEPSKTGATTPVSAENGFKMKLNDIRINHLNLLYNDQGMPMNVELKNTNLNLSGEVAGAMTDFVIKVDAGELVFEYNSVRYISKTKIKAETSLKMDAQKKNFTFSQSKLWVNSLPLEVNGSFAMPNDSMFFDLNFRSEKSDFATILALVPSDYQKYLDKADIKGSAEFKGSVKGLLFNKDYPAIDVLLAVNDASFKYQSLPESIQNIQVSAQITKPQGDLNLLKVNVDKAHASISNNPVDLQMSLSELMTDPNISASFSGTIDFASLKKVIPVDSLDITGILKAQMQLAGRMSSIEKKEYEKFQSKGEATISNFKIVTNQLTKPVEISQGQIKASTQQISVDQFTGKIGQSDFTLQGNVSNYLAYVFKKEVLKGTFNLKSTFMNFSELSNLQKPVKKVSSPTVDKKTPPVNTTSITTTTTTAPKDSVVAFQIPDKLDLTFQSTIQRAVYDNIPITNINGLVKVNGQRMELSNLSMEMLQGKVAINGSYTSNKENKPLFDFKLNMENVDLPAAYQSISTFNRYLPIAGKSQGKFSTQFNLTGVMNENLSLVPTSLNGGGVFSTMNLMIVDSPIFDQIRGVIKKDKLKNVKINDFTAKFKFVNGALTLDPFKTIIADQQATIYGSLTAAQEINLNMDFVVNREDLGADINKGIDILPGSQNIKMVEASVILKGALSKPNVSLDLSKAREQIVQQVKKASMEDLKGSVKKIGDELKKLFK